MPPAAIVHARDDHPAPLDPNFSGAGRVMTDAEGRYRFTTIKPGAYPWRNHHNAWRPAHIHFSLFGQCFHTRLVTQMYFPDDPLLPVRPDLAVGADERARAAAGVALRSGADTSRSGRSAIASISSCAGRDATPFEGRT